MIDYFPEYSESPDFEEDENESRFTFEQVAAKDLAEFNKTRDLLLNTYVSAKKPNDTDFLNYTGYSPYCIGFMRYVAMKTRGYDITMNAEESDFDSSIKLIEASVGRKDQNNLVEWQAKYWEGFLSDDDVMPYLHWFLCAIKDDVDDLYRSVRGIAILMPDAILPIDKDDATIGLSTEDRVLRRKSLLARGYMTSVLVNKLEDKDGLFDMHKLAFEPLYAELYEQGHRPFNGEQLYGLVSALVDEEIKMFNVPPPANQPISYK